jgi:hypothetical protein
MAQVRANYSPTESDKHRLRAAVGSAIAGSVLAGATAANAALTASSQLANGSVAGGHLATTGIVASTKALVSSKLVAALLAGSSLTAGSAYWLSTSAPVEVTAPHTAAPSVIPARSEARTMQTRGQSTIPQVAETVLPEPVPAKPEPSPAKVVMRAPRQQVSEAGQVAAVESAKTSTLLAEAKLVGEASKALRAGDGALALRLLAEHASRYPSGALLQERQGLRALGLCATGQVKAAREAGQLYLQQAPDAPLAVHVKKGCE